MRDGRLFVLVGITLVFTAIFISGCGTDSTDNSKTTGKVEAKSVTIEIKEFAFSPDKVTTGRNGVVTWVNKDDSPHTVTGPGFDSGNLGKGEKYTYTFLKAGKFNYHCAIHPYMQGTVTIK